MLIAIDPGVRKCGIAYFNDLGVLTRAHYANHEETFEESRLGDIFVHLVIEMPRIYRGSGQQKGDLNDLLNLAAVVGYMEAVFPSHTRVFPADWKGQVPKKVMNARVFSKLTLDELRRVEREGAKDHNTLDAIGVGLHHFGRL